jgi:type II secretory pathway pseudopilin PulG
MSIYSAFRIPHSAFRKGGFTLIEIIVMIIIAGIRLPVIVVPFVASVKESGKPEMVNIAMYLAHRRMEEFMKFQYGNAALNPVALTPYANTGVTGYQWQWEIIRVNSDFNTSGTDVGYKRILVRVRDPENSTYEVYSVVTNFP